MIEALPPRGTVLVMGPETTVAQEHVDFPAGPLTVSCWVSWVNPDYQNPEFASYSTSPATATILNYDEDPDGPGDGTRFWITSPANVAVWVGGASTGPTHLDVSDGGWYHLAVTLEPAGDQVYTVGVIKNGGETVVERRILCDPGTALRGGQRLTLGQRFLGSMDDRFIGQLSELAIWNHARSLEDIQRNLTVPLTGNEEGLVLYWPLDTAPQGAITENLAFTQAGDDPFGSNTSRREG